MPQNARAAAAAATVRQQREAAEGGAEGARVRAATAAAAAVAALKAAVKTDAVSTTVAADPAATRHPTAPSDAMCLRQADDWGDYSLTVGSVNMANALRAALSSATEDGIFLALGAFAEDRPHVPPAAKGDVVIALNGEPLLAGALRGGNPIAARVAKVEAAMAAGEESAMEGRGKPGWNPNIYTRPVKLRLRRPGASPPPAARMCLLWTDREGGFVDVLFSHPYGLSLRRGGAFGADLVVTEVTKGAAQGIVLPGDEILAVGGAPLAKGSEDDVMKKLHADLYPSPLEVKFRRKRAPPSTP